MSCQKIEHVINEKLTSDSKINALNFVAFLQENGFTIEQHEEGGDGFAVNYGDKGSAFMLVNGASEIPGPWTVWFNFCDFGDGDLVDDELKQTAWNHTSPCGKCHDGWKDCGCGNRIIFGKEFENICHSPLMFVNVNFKILENVKKLILMIR